MYPKNVLISFVKCRNIFKGAGKKASSTSSRRVATLRRVMSPQKTVCEYKNRVQVVTQVTYFGVISKLSNRHHCHLLTNFKLFTTCLHDNTIWISSILKRYFVT